MSQALTLKVLDNVCCQEEVKEEPENQQSEPTSALPTSALAMRAAEQAPPSPHASKGKGRGRAASGSKAGGRGGGKRSHGQLLDGAQGSTGSSEKGSRASSPKTKCSKQTQVPLPDQALRKIEEIDLSKMLTGEKYRQPIYQARRVSKALAAQNQGESSECLQLDQHLRLAESAQRLSEFASFADKHARDKEMRELLAHVGEIPPACAAEICLAAARDAWSEKQVQTWLAVCLPFTIAEGESGD